MTYKIINTGSDGNATVIEDIILIDCGVSYKKLKPYLDKLKLVLLTHIHQDHFNKRTISLLAKNRPTLRFGCCDWLVQDLIDCGVNKRNIDVYVLDKSNTYNPNFKIKPFKLYHDVSNCGYKVFINNKELIYATDTNSLDGIVAKDYDVYLIEGNYENEEELHNRAYNTIYENRVLSTHLSKEKATEWLLENMNENSTFCWLHEHKRGK